ncbi:MAG: RDD family protein [Chloroflexota bacterium]|nr:RDD family protein [Chloroflexota bacterium]
MSQAGSSADPSPHYPSPHRVDAVPREARPFQGQRAGIVTRTAANVVDFTVVVGVLASGYAAWCALTFLVNPARFSFPAMPFLALLVCFAIVLFAYFTVSWATTGRTYGNHLLALRVVSFRGERLGWPAAVLRAGFCVVLPIGLYWAVLSPTNRSLQDTVLRTSVLYDWTTRSRATRHHVAESSRDERITRRG